MDERVRVLVVVLGAAALFLGGDARHAAAADPPAMPAFKVTSPAGATIASADLSAFDRWLLVYVTPGSRASESLVESLREWKTDDLIERTVILVGGEREQAVAMMKTLLIGDLVAVRWYTDKDRGAWKALALKGVPTLIGVQDARKHWSISGSLNNGTQLESVVRDWVEIRRR